MYRDSLFYLNFTVKSRNVQISLLSRPLHSIKVICTEKLSEKFRMTKNGRSKLFLTIFPKKTGINLEWPKIAILNFFGQFFPKTLVQIWNGQKWPF